MVKNLRQIDPEWTPGFIKLWRAARNAAIRRMVEAFGLTPTQISRLRASIFYLPSGEPVYRYDSYDLPAKLRLDLAVMNMKPKLFYQFKYIRALFSAPGEENPMSPEYIRRIIKQGLNAQ